MLPSAMIPRGKVGLSRGRTEVCRPGSQSSRPRTQNLKEHINAERVRLKQLITKDMSGRTSHLGLISAMFGFGATLFYIGATTMRRVSMRLVPFLMRRTQP